MRLKFLNMFLFGLICTDAVLPESNYKDNSKLSFEQFITLYEQQIEFEAGQEPHITITGDVEFVQILKFLREKFNTSFRLSSMHDSGMVLDIPPKLLLPMLKEINTKFKITIVYVGFYKRDPIYKFLDKKLIESYEESEKLISELILSTKDRLEKQKLMIQREELKRSIIYTKKHSFSGQERDSQLIYQLRDK